LACCSRFRHSHYKQDSRESSQSKFSEVAHSLSLTVCPVEFVFRAHEVRKYDVERASKGLFGASKSYCLVSVVKCADALIINSHYCVPRHHSPADGATYTQQDAQPRRCLSKFRGMLQFPQAITAPATQSARFGPGPFPHGAPCGSLPNHSACPLIFSAHVHNRCSLGRPTQQSAG